MKECTVCNGTLGVAEMTDGKKEYPLCDGCRPLVVTLFHVYASMETAVAEARQAFGRRQ